MGIYVVTAKQRRTFFKFSYATCTIIKLLFVSSFLSWGKVGFHGPYTISPSTELFQKIKDGPLVNEAHLATMIRL